MAHPTLNLDASDSFTQVAAATQRVVASVICRDGRVLVCKRPDSKRHGGLWEFPGGKCESGESDAEAVRRELREELGLEVGDVGSPLFEVADLECALVIAFIPAEASGEPECHEHAEIGWACLSDLDHLELAPCDRLFAGHLIRETRGWPILAAKRHLDSAGSAEVPLGIV